MKFYGCFDIPPLDVTLLGYGIVGRVSERLIAAKVLGCCLVHLGIYQAAECGQSYSSLSYVVDAISGPCPRMSSVIAMIFLPVSSFPISLSFSSLP